MASSGVRPSLNPSAFGKAARSSCFVVLLFLALQGCHSRVAEAPTQPASPQALTDSLIYATREFCVPYVVDGASVATLTRRPDVSEQHYNVHGQDVTRYRLDKPGSPEVTLSRQVYCRVDAAQSSDRLEIVAAFARNLRFDGRHTTQPHYVELPGALQGEAPEGWHARNVMCVHGKSEALITILSPTPEYPISVYVQSDLGITAAQSCIAEQQPPH